ncbi:hypothetical protein CDAR_582931 [Caerostris darwini]|uniref:Uncharacterized protein n=1 Tax=Caerostris darwini TaxID=1538125 RepID=A0AAV4SHX4_9ARAC|nr:hypothetical protein CDAR_582931 [Caerostris darwini]
MRKLFTIEQLLTKNVGHTFHRSTGRESYRNEDFKPKRQFRSPGLPPPLHKRGLLPLIIVIGPSAHNRVRPPRILYPNTRGAPHSH